MATTEDFENEGSTKRRIIGGVLVVAVIGGIASFFFKDHQPAPKKAKPQELVSISLPPLPLPPPPPPPPEPETPPEPQEEEMVEQEPIAEAEPEPEAPGPEEPAADLGTGLSGDGPGGFGLSSRGDGGGRGQGGTGRRGGGRFDGYAVILQNTLAAELRRNPKTRSAAFNVQVSLRIDAEGRISELTPKSSTGDPSVDAALRNDFIGVRFSKAPPADMPMPVHTRLVGRKR